MFKPITAFLLLLAFMAQTFNRAVILTDYYVNTAAFAKNCENKAKPQMHCNGKCQMMKKMRQEEKKDKQNAEHSANNIETAISSKSFFPKVEYFPVFVSKHFALYTATLPEARASSFFHPPSA